MTPAETLLEQARQQLTRQEKKFDAWRTTAGALLAAGGVVVGLIASHLGSHMSTTSDVFSGLATGSFAAGAACAVMVLIPRDAHFAERLTTPTEPGGESYADWADHHSHEDEAEHSFIVGLARALDKARELNEPGLARMSTWLTAECALYGVSAVAWAIASLTR